MHTGDDAVTGCYFTYRMNEQEPTTSEMTVCTAQPTSQVETVSLLRNRDDEVVLSAGRSTGMMRESETGVMAKVLHARRVLSGEYIKNRVSQIRAICNVLQEGCRVALVSAPVLTLPGCVMQREKALAAVNTHLLKECERSSIEFWDIHWPNNMQLWAADRLHLSDLGVMYQMYWIQQKLWEAFKVKEDSGFGHVLTQPLFNCATRVAGEAAERKPEGRFGYRTPPHFRSMAFAPIITSKFKAKARVLLIGDSNLRIMTEPLLLRTDWQRLGIVTVCIPGLSLYTVPRHLTDYFNREDAYVKDIKMIVIVAATDTSSEYEKAEIYLDKYGQQ